MNKPSKILLLILASVFLAVGSALAVPMNDNYVGATSTNQAVYPTGTDRIGHIDQFELWGATANVTGNTLDVKIYGTFFDNIGQFGAVLGDLFISTNGYNPFGSAPYVLDNASNGEAWELAAVLDDHTATSGSLSLFNTADGTVRLSDYFFAGSPSYRSGQEVQFAADPNAVAVGAGKWYVGNAGTVQGYATQYLALSILLPQGINLSDMAIHWGMTCANDVVEIPVPEPGSLLLLGVGLLGFGLVRRKIS